MWKEWVYALIGGAIGLFLKHVVGVPGWVFGLFGTCWVLYIVSHVRTVMRERAIQEVEDAKEYANILREEKEWRSMRAAELCAYRKERRKNKFPEICED